MARDNFQTNGLIIRDYNNGIDTVYYRQQINTGPGVSFVTSLTGYSGPLCFYSAKQASVVQHDIQGRGGDFIIRRNAKRMWYWAFRP